MEIGTRNVLLSVAVTLLVCGQLTDAAGVRSDRGSCDLSIFRTLPPVVMRTFHHFRNHYVRVASPRYSAPLVIPLEALTELSVAERRVLVRAEFEIFTGILGNATDESLGVLKRKMCNNLSSITVELTKCVVLDGLSSDQYSPQLSLQLKRLTDVKDHPTSSADTVMAGLAQLLNEHLACVAGAQCQ